MKADNVHVIIVDPYLNRRTAETVAAKTGATVVDVTQFPGGVKGTEGGYIALMDYLVNSVAKALGRKAHSDESTMRLPYGTASLDEMAADREPDSAVAAGLSRAAHRPARGDLRGPRAGADRRASAPASPCSRGYDVHDWQSYAFSLGFTLVGAVVLTFTRSRDQRVPQEALIGIVYVVAAAAAILALEQERRRQ